MDILLFLNNFPEFGPFFKILAKLYYAGFFFIDFKDGYLFAGYVISLFLNNMVPG